MRRIPVEQKANDARRKLRPFNTHAILCLTHDVSKDTMTIMGRDAGQFELHEARSRPHSNDGCPQVGADQTDIHGVRANPAVSAKFRQHWDLQIDSMAPAMFHGTWASSVRGGFDEDHG
jgi:hypothetical protein